MGGVIGKQQNTKPIEVKAAVPAAITFSYTGYAYPSTEVRPPISRPPTPVLPDDEKDREYDPKWAMYRRKKK